MGILVTIYSQHPNRGKVQILATHQAPEGVSSSTVTSVETAELANPIVDALNRVSACATVPVSVWDTRKDGDFSTDHYPTAHLDALAAVEARAGLLSGTHSIWYERVKLLLHEALCDLDNALSAVPAPVRTAVAAELATEAHELRAAVAEGFGEVEPTKHEHRRLVEWGNPLVAIGGHADKLNRDSREHMNTQERGLSSLERAEVIKDMRMLLDAYALCGSNAYLYDEFTIEDDPHGLEEIRYYLTVEASWPESTSPDEDWVVAIGRWDINPNIPGNEDETATGETVLTCAIPRPQVPEIVALFDLSGGNAERIAAWAKTPVGQPLHGTNFVVTQRLD
ncbi:hypothetical protein SK803_16155 [Lentzea sp. BCCO 10_0856]|uniref:Uncharacterized protein n=1 Tax=Lentzea miocenica TaxID=3095431 RepID=A0ABU4T0R9_9PSEU|nr:hypothetical protein [Lentzea sp. BCCO 10_0856]MDX8031758.1 hypothetical protein [Lentzea sp. BCCO 10_0856]